MVKLLDLRVCDAKVEYDGIWSGKCGYRWLELSFKIKLKVYVKYEIARWTYHDKLVIYCDLLEPDYESKRIVDKVVVNTSDQNIIKEEIINASAWFIIPYTSRTDDMRKSGYKGFKLAVCGEGWACMKTLNVSFYWKPCSVSNITVKGIQECPGVKPTLKITSFKVEPTEAYVNQDVKVTAMLQGTPNSTWTAELYVNYRKVDEEKVTLGRDGKETAYFTIKPKSSGSYYIYVCLVGGDGMKVCSSPVTVVVRKGAKPEITYFDVSPKEVKEGETVNVTANVRNAGDTAGTFKIYTVVNGTKKAEKTVTINPGQQYTYKVALKMPSAGSYSVNVCTEVV